MIFGLCRCAAQNRIGAINFLLKMKNHLVSNYMERVRILEFANVFNLERESLKVVILHLIDLD